MNNENDLEREFLVYAAKVELKQHQEMTEIIDLDSAKLKNELATAYLELVTLKGKMVILRRELLAKDEEIDRLNQEVKELKNGDNQAWRANY